MSCESCYNGCVEIVSDQCVKYTGEGSESLDITYGDNLQVVINNIIDGLVPLLTGEGDKILLIEAIRCALIDGYLPSPTEADTWNSAQLFEALVKVVCDLQSQIDAIDAELVILNGNYTIGCLTGVTSSSDTHDIVQAIITKLCTVAADLTALELDVDTNYVKLADLDALIAAYIASQSGGVSTQQYLKMVPYVAYEYYGPIGNFDGSGIGLATLGFYKVYICNGLNGTPDKRGRVAVGAIQNVPPINSGLDAAVNPSNPGNPNYALYTTAGANTVTLITSEIPSHSHTATANTNVTLNDPGHTHYINYLNKGGSDGSNVIGSQAGPNNKAVSTSTTGITVASTSTSVTVNAAGGGGSHANIQPVIAAYYIMYIP